MTKNILIPIYILVALTIFCIATIIIQIIQSQNSRLNEEDDYLTTFFKTKQQEIEKSGSGISFPVYIALTIGLPFILFFACFFFMHETVGGIILAIIGFFTPNLLVKFLGKRQKARFDERYARALKALSSDIQAGMSIQQAVEDITNSPFVHENIKRGFRQINADIKTGIPVAEAFQHFANEFDSPDTKDVATSIAMQAEVGGSEARVIEMVSTNIRDRLMLRKEIKTLFADTSVIVNVMDILPFLVFAGVYFFAYDLIVPFFESTTMTMLLIGILLFTLIGSYFIRKKIKEAKGANE